MHTQTASSADEPLAGMPAIPDASLMAEAELMTQLDPLVAQDFRESLTIHLLIRGECLGIPLQ